jgi:hypothetical protein
MRARLPRADANSALVDQWVVVSNMPFTSQMMTALGRKKSGRAAPAGS